MLRQSADSPCSHVTPFQADPQDSHTWLWKHRPETRTPHRAARQARPCRSPAARTSCQLKHQMCLGTQVPARSDRLPPEGCPKTTPQKCQMWPELGQVCSGDRWLIRSLCQLNSAFTPHSTVKIPPFLCACRVTSDAVPLPLTQRGTVTDSARQQSTCVYTSICTNLCKPQEIRDPTEVIRTPLFLQLKEKI